MQLQVRLLDLEPELLLVGGTGSLGCLLLLLRACVQLQEAAAVAQTSLAGCAAAGAAELHCCREIEL